MGRYVISDKAASDLAEIEDGFLERGGSQTNANKLILGLLGACQDLADFPNAGNTRDYLQSDELAFPHNKYMIVYMKHPDQKDRIDVLQVVFGGMDLFAYFAEDE